MPSETNINSENTIPLNTNCWRSWLGGIYQSQDWLQIPVFLHL